MPAFKQTLSQAEVWKIIRSMRAGRLPGDIVTSGKHPIEHVSGHLTERGESLIEHRKPLLGAGFPVHPQPLRVSVAIENADDLIADLD